MKKYLNTKGSLFFIVLLLLIFGFYFNFYLNEANAGCAIVCPIGSTCVPTSGCPPPLPPPVGIMSGYILPVDSVCTIPLGGSSCAQTLTWSTLFPIAISAITTQYPYDNTVVVNGNSGSQSFTVVHPSTVLPDHTAPPPDPNNYVTFFLYNNEEELAHAVVYTSCADGSIWSVADNKCIIAPISVSLSASPTTVTLPSIGTASTTLSWSTAGGPESCVAVENGDWLGSKDVNGGSQSISYSLADEGTYIYSISCTKGESTVWSSATVVVTRVKLPDLQVSIPFFNTVTAGTSTTLNATVYNYGNKEVSGEVTVPHVFEFTEIYPPENAVFEKDINFVMTSSSQEIPKLVESIPGSIPISSDYTFPDKGTPYNIYARVCADLDANNALQGTVDESNEDNNCSSSWTEIKVALPSSSGNSASCYFSILAPTAVKWDQTFSATVNMNNTGGTSWTSPGYQLGSQTPADNTVWTQDARIDLLNQVTVSPGDSASFVINAKAPPNPQPNPQSLSPTCVPTGVAGSYECNFDWAMIEDDVWFDEQCTQKITVSDSGLDLPICAPNHFYCDTGTYSGDGIGSPTKWRWTCATEESSVVCEEKNAPEYIED